MFCLAVISACFAISLANLDSSWETYKLHHNKNYGKQELLRKKIWERNVEYIQQHNLKADLGHYTYRLGVNEYTDLTSFEYKKFLNGLLISNKTTGSSFLEPSNLQLPTTVDWRDKGYVTPVKNQKQCGSCWAFSATGSLEGQHFKKTGKLVSLSEQNLVDCSKAEGNNGCFGGLPDYAFKYVQLTKGIDTEQSYPYTAKDGACNFKRADIGATCTGYVDINHGDEQALMKAVASIGPISVGIDASRATFQSYKSGIYDDPECSSTYLDHGVLAVGYGTENGQDYWLVKNSWGESWGDNGYIKMSRNKHNQCGIATQASYPLV